MRWAQTSRVKPTSSRYLSPTQPTGGPNGIGRWRIGGGVRQRPVTAFGPTAVSCATTSSFGEVRAFADLQLVHAVDPVVRVDLPVERHAAHELVHELLERRLRVGRRRARAATTLRTSHPVQSVGSAHSSSVNDAQQCGEAAELLLGEHAGLGSFDAGVDGVVQSSPPAAVSRYRSIKRSRWRVQRFPGRSSVLCRDQSADHGDEAVDVALRPQPGVRSSAAARPSASLRARTTRATARSPGSAGGRAAPGGRCPRRRSRRTRA